MIELVNLCKTYDNKTKNSIEALCGVSMIFPDTGMVFIVGRSGGGKSTLLNILGGMDTYTSGDFLINGVSTSNFTKQNWDSYRNNYVGFVFQEHNLMPQYNVRENLEFALSLQSKSTDENKIDTALEAVDLKGFGDRNVCKLSGGQRQRVAIARALVKNYEMIVADEPTGNLDKTTAHEIFSLLKSISKTKLVVVVTHDVSAANAYADVAIAINNGEIVDNATKENTLAQSEQVAKALPKPKLKFEKSKLANIAILRVIKRTFSCNKFKMLLTIFVAVLSLLMLLTSFKYATFDAQKKQATAMKFESASIISAIEYTPGERGALSKKYRKFDEKEIALFKEKFSQEPVYMVDFLNSSMNLSRDLMEYQKLYYTKSVVGECQIDENGIKSLGYKLLCGQYPTQQWGSAGVLITKYMFDVIKLCGIYVDNLDKVIFPQNYDDLIGKSVNIDNTYIVRGIIDTNISDKKFQEVKAYVDKNVTDKNQHEPEGKKPKEYLGRYSQSYLTREVSVHRMVFTYANTEQKQGMQYILQKNSSKTNFKKAEFVFNNNQCFQFEGAYANEIGIFEEMTNSNIMLTAIIILAMFGISMSVFLIVNFISGSIMRTRQEIGILRCVGASKKDIFVIYLWFTAIFVALIFSLTIMLFAFLACPFLSFMDILTIYYPFNMYSANLVDVSVLLGFVSFTAILSVVLPLVKILKQTPVEILSNSKI